MRQIHINEIFVDDEKRIRKEFSPQAEAELTESIGRVLIQAPTLRYNASLDRMELVAGGRRLRSIRKLFEQGRSLLYNDTRLELGMVPYTAVSDLSPAEAYRVELEENIRRLDITWQERIMAQSRLDELLEKTNPDHTVVETARFIYGETPKPNEVHTVKNNIRLADHINNPAIQNAKTEREAISIVRRELEDFLREELVSLTPISQQDYLVLNADSADFLDGLLDESVTAAVTDPAYGIGADTFTLQGGQEVGELHEYEDTPENAERLVKLLATAKCFKPSAHIWMFCDIRLFERWKAVYAEHGWYVWPFPIIWDKVGVGNLLGNANGPRHCYEVILFAQRGSLRVTQVFNDILHVRADTFKDHAAQKPVELFRTLIAMSCVPGDTVIDICCGSGTIFEAAALAKVKASGCDISARSVALSQERIMAIVC